MEKRGEQNATLQSSSLVLVFKIEYAYLVSLKVHFLPPVNLWFCFKIRGLDVD